MSENPMLLSKTNEEHQRSKEFNSASSSAAKFSRSASVCDGEKQHHNFPSHFCFLSHDVDLMKLLMPDNTVWQRMKRCWYKLCMIDQRSPLTSQVFRSDTAIKREILRHKTYFRDTIHPLSFLRFIWECIMIVTFTAAFQMIPYDVMLLFRASDYYPFTAFHKILLATDALCILDIVMSFFTGTYVRRNQRVELDLGTVRRKYMRFWFWIDLVSSAPDPLITRLIPLWTLDNSLLYCLHKLDFHPGCLWDFWNLMSVLKVFRFCTCLKYIRSLCQRLGLRRNVIKFITILATVLTVFHWGSCIQFLVIRLVQGPDPQLIDTRSWTQKIQFWNQSSFVQYLECSFRTLYTVTHITHDLHDSMTYEDMLISLIYTVCGYLLKIYLLAQLFIFIRILFSSTSKYHEYRYELSNYMRHEQLPVALQQQILEFYDIRHPKHYSRSTLIRATVSEQLFGDLRMEILAPLIRACFLFRDVLTKEQLTALAVGMHFQLFLKHDIITLWESADRNNGVDSKWNMIFIVSGTVAIFTNTGKPVLHLEDGEHFGEFYLLLKERMVKFPKIVAAENTELFMLSHKTFNAFLHPYPALRKNLLELTAEQLHQMDQLEYKALLECLPNVETSTELPLSMFLLTDECIYDCLNYV